MPNNPWTPGPWEVDEQISGALRIVSADGDSVLTIATVDVPLDPEGAAADARLIAAAPELYEALEKMRGILRGLQPALNVMAREVLDDIIAEQIEPALSLSRARTAEVE